MEGGALRQHRDLAGLVDREHPAHTEVHHAEPQLQAEGWRDAAGQAELVPCGQLAFSQGKAEMWLSRRQKHTFPPQKGLS